MKNTAMKAIVLILLLAVGVFAFLYFTTNSKLENELSKGLDQKLEYLKKEYDRKDEELKNTITVFNETIEILNNRADKIKYVPYEKLLYVDRDVNTALDVIAAYHYDSGTNSKKE